MQNTRINRLIDVLGEQFGRWLSNPWRRISLLVISLLFGTFLGTAISTIAGQSADWDIIAAGLLVLLTELVNRLVYGSPRPLALALAKRSEGKRSEGKPAPTGAAPTKRSARSLWVDMLNALKVGLTYNLFVEAFKLGS